MSFDGLFFEDAAQVFEPFKLLVAAVMALTILVIIIGAINYFEGLRLEISKERFFDGLFNAVKQPNGDYLVISEVQFNRGDSFSSSGIAKALNLPADCVSFKAHDSVAISSSPDLVVFNESVMSNVYVSCDEGTTTDCEISCLISFEEI